MTVLTLQQVTDLAVQAGFFGDGLRTVLAVAQAESGFDTLARNTAGNNPPSTDRGILQINSYWHKEVTDAEADDPAFAFRWAFPETKQGTDFHEWATFTSGAYERYLVTTLPNFPHKDQRTESTKDGRPPENGNYDCVATSFACAIQYYDGGTVSGDELKDAEYGESYANQGTAMVSYVDQASDKARATYGVTAVPLNGDPWTCVRTIHSEVDAGRPVVATIPSSWGSTRAQLGWTNPAAPGGWTHVIVFFKTASGSLTAMNPWGGFDHVGTDQYWADRLCFNQVWSVRKEAAGVTPSMPLDISAVSSFFTLQSNGNWLAPATGKFMMGGILGAYRTLPDALGGMHFLGLPITDELYPMSGVAVQVFERGVLVYDPTHKFDSPPGAGDVYFGHIDKGTVLDQLASAMKAQLDTAQTDLAAARVQVTTLSQQLAAAKSVAAGAQAQIDAAKAAQASAEAAVAQMQPSLDAANAQVQSLTTQVQAKQQEVDAANAQVASITASHAAASDAIVALAAALKNVGA